MLFGEAGRIGGRKGNGSKVSYNRYYDDRRDDRYSASVENSIHSPLTRPLYPNEVGYPYIVRLLSRFGLFSEAASATGAVLACKATTKAGKIIEEANDAISTIHQANENGVTNVGKTYSEQDCKKDLAVAYVQTGVKFAKLYAPSVLLGAASITSILASHNIMKKRNVALAAAYAAVDKSFKDYRGA